MPLIAGSLPPNTCYGTPQQLLDLFGAYLSLPGQNTILEGKKASTFNITAGTNISIIPTVGKDTLTVSGASIGDPVVIGVPSPPDGVLFDAYVSASNIVTIRCTYVKTGLSMNSQNYTVKVFKFGGVYP